MLRGMCTCGILLQSFVSGEATRARPGGPEM